MGRAATLLLVAGIGWSPPPATRPEYQVVTMMQWAPAPAIAKELRRIDPAADDWEAEVFAVAAHRTLDELKPALLVDTPAVSVGFDGPVNHVEHGWTVEPLPFHGMDDQRYGRQDRPDLDDRWIEIYNTRWVGPFSRVGRVTE